MCHRDAALENVSQLHAPLILFPNRMAQMYMTKQSLLGIVQIKYKQKRQKQKRYCLLGASCTSTW